MCNYSDYVYAQGIAEGEAKGEAKGKAEGRTEGKIEALLRSIRNVMSGFGVSYDKAAEVLNLSEEEIVLVREYSDELEKKNGKKTKQDVSLA